MTALPPPTRVAVLGGFLGSGKTTLLRRLLADRPADERWAVLINEFGSVGIDGALVPAEGVTVQELAGGCICCSALVAFRAAVVALLRRRPARLLIEPTGLAGLGAVRALLAEPGIAPSVRVDPLLVLIHPSQWANAAIRAFPVYQEQLEAADVIGITHADSAAPADLARLRADLVATPHFDITDGQLDASALARAAASRRLRLRPLLDDPDTADPAVDGRGWIWPSTAIADLARLETALLADPTARCAWRCKGILRAADGWYEIHLADGRLQRSPRGPHSDARLEMLHPRATATQPPPDWARVAEILAECIAEER